MRVLLAAALSCPGLWGVVPAAAQSSEAGTAETGNDYPPVYRVEAIVFRHARGRSDRRAADAPVDFTDRLDPLLVATAMQAAQRQLAALATFLPVARIPGEPDAGTPYLETEGETLRPIPPVYAALDRLSTPVQRALDRLGADPAYEPLAARAWIQLAPPRRRTAGLRLHDDRVVHTLEPPGDASAVPVARVLPFGPLVETPPPAAALYRLDGTVRLRQRQFLHLDLDLVWQMPDNGSPDAATAADPASATGTDAATTRDADSRDDRRDEAQWELHRLRQSRVVRPGRLEYFDSSLFGVLVRIERFEQVVPEPPEADAADDPERPSPAPDPR